MAHGITRRADDLEGVGGRQFSEGRAADSSPHWIGRNFVEGLQSVQVQGSQTPKALQTSLADT